MLIENMTNWEILYWATAIIVLGIGMMSSIMWKNWIPITWSGIVAGLLICFNAWISPIFTGWSIYGNTILGLMCLVCTVLFMIIIAQCCYNMVMYGEVSQ